MNKTSNKFRYLRGKIETISVSHTWSKAIKYYSSPLIWSLNQIHPRNGMRHVFKSSANYKLLLWFTFFAEFHKQNMQHVCKTMH